MAGIRPATPADVEAIRACVRAAYAPYVERMDREPAPMTADYAALVAQGVVVVLEDDAGLAGVLVSFPQGDHYFVENVAVAPERHGRGLGRVLLEHAEDEARRAGLPELRLYTNEVMTENLVMYPHLGWEETERRVEDGFRRVYFRKPVGDAPAG